MSEKDDQEGERDRVETESQLKWCEDEIKGSCFFTCFQCVASSK